MGHFIIEKWALFQLHFISFPAFFVSAIIPNIIARIPIINDKLLIIGIKDVHTPTILNTKLDVAKPLFWLFSYKNLLSSIFIEFYHILF